MKKLLALLVALALMLVCVVGAAIAVITTPLAGDLRTSCSVGVVGTSASITVSGLLAGRMCWEMLNDSSGNFCGLSQAPTQPVICEYQRGRQRLIVRDEGVLKLVGNAVCANLRRPSSGTAP